jgi:hypothetical protein
VEKGSHVIAVINLSALRVAVDFLLVERGRAQFFLPEKNALQGRFFPVVEGFFVCTAGCSGTNRQIFRVEW